VINALLTQDADVGLAFNTRPGPRLRVITSVQPRFGAVMAPDHPLALRTKVTLLDCAAHPLVVPSDDWLDQSMTHSLFPGGLGDFNVVARGGRASILRAFARAGVGITFLTRLEVEADVRAGHLVHIPLADRRIGVPTLSLLVPARQTSLGVISVFTQRLDDELRRDQERGAEA
jgi:DNA-binding transcriptional LysR family regulator